MIGIEKQVQHANELMKDAKQAMTEKNTEGAMLLAMEALFEQNKIIVDLVRDMRHRQVY